jgi:hypothetical protein
MRNQTTNMPTSVILITRHANHYQRSYSILPRKKFNLSKLFPSEYILVVKEHFVARQLAKVTGQDCKVIVVDLTQMAIVTAC